MIEYTEYDPASGRVKWLVATDTTPWQLADGVSAVLGSWDGADYYVVNGQAVERPTQSTTLTGTIISNMPIPATLLVDGARIEVDDGKAELELLLSGAYKLRVEAWPYKDWEGEVTV